MKFEGQIVTIILLASIGVVFALQNILQNIFDFQSFAFVPAYAFSRPWTFITAMFLHADLTHIFFNGFALMIFGTYLEARVSKQTFILIYFLGGILGNIGYMITATNSLIPGIGASGAIYGIMGALAILAPRAVVFVYGIPMPMIAALFVWAALEIFGVFVPQGNIASGAHLFGLIAGVAFAFYLRRQYNSKTKLFFEDLK